MNRIAKQTNEMLMDQSETCIHHSAEEHIHTHPTSKNNAGQKYGLKLKVEFAHFANAPSVLHVVW